MDAVIVAPLTASLSPTRDKGWEPLEGSDLMWLSLVSIDDTWSAFGLLPYKPGEARQTFR